MEKTSVRIAAFVVALALPFSSNAAPVQIDYSSIPALSEEAFEAFPIGQGLSSPVDFNGFRYRSSSTPVVLGTVGTTQCLSNCLTSAAIVGSRTFFDFGSGNTGFGLRLFANDTRDDIGVTVVGKSSQADFSIMGSGLYGFFDPAGLVSVTFNNRGFHPPGGGTSLRNYEFDDVITAVPLPASAVVLVTGLAGLGFARRRRPKPASV